MIYASFTQVWKAVCFYMCQMMLLGICAAQESAQKTFKYGPYSLMPVINYYAIVENVPCKITGTVYLTDSKKEERLLARVYGPDEEPIAWTYKEDFKDSSKFVESLILTKPGIYEFRFCGGLCNSTVMLESDQKLEYGISWQNGTLIPFSKKPEPMYVYIPKGLDYLTFHAAAGAVIDTGKEVEKIGSNSDKKIAIAKTDTVWKVTFPNTEFRVTLDMPMIFCTSEAAARKIRNSVEVTEDGNWSCFAAQKKIPDVIKRLWSEKYVGKPDNIIVPIASIKEKALSDPLRCFDMASVLSQMPALLHKQDRQNGKLDICEMEALCVLAGTCPDINPYYHKKEIVNRSAVALLYCLYERLTEDEFISVKPGTDTSLPAISTYAYKRNVHNGFWQQALCYDTFIVADAFGNLGRALKELDAEAYDITANLMRRVTDRSIPMPNSKTFSKEMNYPISIWQFYEATGEERYKEQALNYGYYLIRNTAPAGYSVMYGGPDSTYQGQILGYLSLFYCWSKDEKILKYIKDIYTLFNHTVAPEPNNKIISSSSFCHGCIGGFERLNTSSVRLLSGVLPEAAIWSANHYDNSPSLESFKKKILQVTDKPKEDKPLSYLMGHGALFAAAQYEFAATTANIRNLLNKSRYAWPTLEKNNFTRNFGDEFIAVKRNGYYVCIYVGKPLPTGEGVTENLRKIQDSMKNKPMGWVKNQDRVDIKQPVEGNADADFTEFNRLREISNVIPYSGGNIALLWSKDYGTSVLSHNIAPTTRHGLIFTDASSARWWDDYIKTEFTLDEQKGILHIKGRIENQPVKYERIYAFKENHLEYTLILEAEKTVSAASLVENFPVAMKYKGVSIDLTKVDLNGQSAVKMTSKSSGESVIIAAGKKLDVTLLPDYVGGQGSVQFHLPEKLEPGKKWRTVFSVIPVSKSGNK